VVVAAAGAVYAIAYEKTHLYQTAATNDLPWAGIDPTTNMPARAELKLVEKFEAFDLAHRYHPAHTAFITPSNDELPVRDAIASLEQALIERGAQPPGDSSIVCVDPLVMIHAPLAHDTPHVSISTNIIHRHGLMWSAPTLNIIAQPLRFDHNQRATLDVGWTTLIAQPMQHAPDVYEVVAAPMPIVEAPVEQNTF